MLARIRVYWGCWTYFWYFQIQQGCRFHISTTLGGPLISYKSNQSMSAWVSESSNTASQWGNQSGLQSVSHPAREHFFFADSRLHLPVDLCHSSLAASHGVFLRSPPRQSASSLNYRYTLITSLWGRQNLWKSLRDPPPPSPPLPPTTALSHAHAQVHKYTDSHINFYLESSFLS